MTGLDQAILTPFVVDPTPAVITGLVPFAAVASVAGAGTSGGVTTTAITTTGATLLVISASWVGSSTNPPISDSKSNTWTQSTVYNSTTNIYHCFYYCLSPTVGTGHTCTLTQSSSYPAIVVYAFSGGVAALDQQNGAVVTTGTGPLATGPITPSATTALVLTGFAGNSGSASGAPAGFTGYLSQAAASGNNVGAAAAYQILTTGLTVNPSWSWSPSTYASVSVASFTTRTIRGLFSPLTRGLQQRLWTPQTVTSQTTTGTANSGFVAG